VGISLVSYQAERLRSPGYKRVPKCPDISGTTKVGSGGMAAIGTGERLLVDKFPQGILARRARVETALRNRVAAAIAAFERIAERLRLLCRWRQLDVRNEFHTHKNKMIREALQRRSAFLPRLKSGACSAEVL
jgi:hypothetical protein